MKKTIVMVAMGAALLCGVAAQAQDVKIKKGKATMTEAYYNELKAKAEAYDQLRAAPVTFNDSASYAIGRDIYNQWNAQQLGIDGRMAGLAMMECAIAQPRFGDNVAHPLLQRFQRAFEERSQAAGRENIEKGEKFLKEISNNKSVYTTKSGLKYRKIKEGNGKKPKATDRVKVHYTGKLIDGKTFDSSVDRGQPITFGLGDVIPGWTEGLQLMDEGSKYMLYIPYNLGYGMRDMGNIPAGSTLVFEVELLEINPK
jgi:FKBP-type peptidyl-prolyl cis-trans isomerase FklB